MSKHCTYIEWDPQKTQINDDFVKACSPVQFRDGSMVVHAETGHIQKIADKYHQSGLTITAGLRG